MQVFLIEKQVLKELLKEKAGIEIPGVRIMSDEEIDFDHSEPGITYRRAFSEREIPAKFAMVMM